MRAELLLFAMIGAACAEGSGALADASDEAIPIAVAPRPWEILDAPVPAPRTETQRFEREVGRWQAHAESVTVLVNTPHLRGSGVIVSRDGLIVTASHVVLAEDELAIAITLPDGTSVPATVTRRDVSRDLLLLRAATTLSTCAPTTLASPPSGSWLLCSGAVGIEHSEMDASIGTVTSPMNGSRWIDTSCRLGRGMSGGPVLDREGHVTGVAVSYTGPIGRAARLFPSGRFMRDVRCDAEPLASIALDGASPDRLATLRALATPQATHPSVVFVTFDAVRYGPSLRGVAGVVVAPGVVLTLTTPELAWFEDGTPTTPRSIESEPTAHAIRGEIRGELTMIRFEGLTAPPIAAVRSVFAPGTVVVSAHESGIVSRTDATPGYVEPFIQVRPSHCGLRSMYLRQAHPAATLPHAFVHDAAAQRGELLVDAAGVPLGIHVAAQGGIGFAVPLAEAIASFPADVWALARP